VVSASTKSAAAEPGITVNTNNKKKNSNNKQQQLQQQKHGAQLFETLQKNQRKHPNFIYFQRRKSTAKPSILH
jgi:hypothetical protein